MSYTQRISAWERDLRKIEDVVEVRRLQEEKTKIQKKIDWIIHAEDYLEGIKYRAAKKLADIDAKQAKEYLELFPPTCSKPDPIPVPDLNAEIMKELTKFQAGRPSIDPVVSEVSSADRPSPTGVYEESSNVTSAFGKGLMAKNPLGARGVDAVQVSSHRGPPTDRPPDRPDRAVNVSGGCSQERVNTQYPVFHLASSLSLAHSLSGKSTPFAENAIYGVQKPSDYAKVPSQDVSSHEVNRDLSWMLPRCGRFRVKRDTCVSLAHPSSNLGRNLFARGVFLPHPIQQGQERSATELPCPKEGSQSEPNGHGLRAVRRVQLRRRWGSTK
jgi:hypothetical protein